MRVGQARKRDALERPIIETLRAMGCEVWQISEKGAPDLVVGHWTPGGMRWQVLEVKSPGGTLTPAQARATYRAIIPVVRSVDEAIREVFGDGLRFTTAG